MAADGGHRPMSAAIAGGDRGVAADGAKEWQERRHSRNAHITDTDAVRLRTVRVSATALDLAAGRCLYRSRHTPFKSSDLSSVNHSTDVSASGRNQPKVCRLQL